MHILIYSWNFLFDLQVYLVGNSLFSYCLTFSFFLSALCRALTRSNCPCAVSLSCAFWFIGGVKLGAFELVVRQVDKKWFLGHLVRRDREKNQFKMITGIADPRWLSRKSLQSDHQDSVHFFAYFWTTFLFLLNKSEFTFV